MRTPRAIDIAVTNDCNLRCSYCSHFSSPGDVKHDLQAEEWLQFFKELNECSVMRVVLEGGEPFYRKDIFEIIEGIVKNRMRYSILTNGTLITEDIARFLSSAKRCDAVQVSIDGSNENIHDIYRGKGTFQKAINGLKCLKENGVPVTVRVTIHKENVTDLENVAKLLLEDIGIPTFSTNSASYMGLCQQNSKKIRLDTNDRMLAMNALLKLTKKYPGRIHATAGPLADAKAWMEMEKARKEGNDIQGRGYLTGCGCPFERLAVRADGVIVPCQLLSQIELGRINEDRLIDIWQRHPEMIRLRERRMIPLNNFDLCSDCEYIKYCTGNCPANTYNITGNLDHPDPDGCLRTFLRNGGKIPET
ncbi:SynChlorMet cassette radical SAM/SPASM protein ScmE [Methanocella sp. CWC-04]|uniref:SynChlorMet cassette radical SAM/SPASM protein ScmE n=1 Tax=Methanooceanicella nereidis TaxID=2052831 RepID=A0AAP2W4Y8_9EURY|nr:SynChlorMet cassette radical SAM/SPASM protein ScmE [Methanocella sp. CWC-04]